MRRVLAVLFACSSAVACVQLFGGDDVPVFGDAEDASTGGAGRDASGAGDATPSPKDAGASDGGWCATNHPTSEGCWDFDDVTVADPIRKGWESESATGLGKTTTTYASSPNGFLSIIDSDHRASELWKHLPIGSAKTVVYGFDVKFSGCTVPAQNSHSLAILGFEKFRLFLRFLPNGDLATCSNASGCDEAHANFVGAPTGAWIRVTFEISIAGSSADATITVAGARTTFTTSSLDFLGETLDVYLGLHADVVSETCQATYDNAWLDVSN